MIIITCSFLIFMKPHTHKLLRTVKIFIFHIVKIYFVHNLPWGWIKLSFSMCVYPPSSYLSLFLSGSAPCKLRHNIQRFIYGRDDTRQLDDVADIFCTFWLRCQWSLNISLSFPAFYSTRVCPFFHFNLLQIFLFLLWK